MWGSIGPARQRRKLFERQEEPQGTIDSIEEGGDEVRDADDRPFLSEDSPDNRAFDEGIVDANNNVTTYGPILPTEAQIWGAKAEKAVAESRKAPLGKALARLMHFKDPACALIARIASHHKWSIAETEAIVRGVLPVFQALPHPALDEIMGNRKKINTTMLWESASDDIIPVFEAQMLSVPMRDGTPFSVPTWSLRQHLELFLKDLTLSRHLIAVHCHDGENYGNFTSGSEFRDCCESCEEDVIAICLELSFDDTHIGGQVAGPMYFGICNLSDAVKGQNRHADNC